MNAHSPQGDLPPGYDELLGDVTADRQEEDRLSLVRAVNAALTDFLVERRRGAMLALDAGEPNRELFRHTRLRRHVALHVVTGRRQMEGHRRWFEASLELADEMFRDTDDDGRTIGILVCLDPDDVVVDYSDGFTGDRLDDLPAPWQLAEATLRAISAWEAETGCTVPTVLT
ncbi:hypothetical protein ACPA54_11250 [Uniformispora flossi]|uniref:hypothetical protein n=1 Tax=Uniformispora flossi TaxID=3390723 RepID=UPI003C2ABDE4